MSEATFREKVEPAVEPSATAKETTSGTITKVEVPFSDYSREHGSPYTVDLFGLGEHWTDGIGGFTDEVGAIENYLKEQVDNREIDNSLTAVKKRIKEIEKITGIEHEDRTTVRMEIIAEYVKFLMKKSDIHRNITRYS
jgi:hypothetical protein